MPVDIWRSSGLSRHRVLILCSFEVLLVFPNFLRSQVLSRATSRNATVIYQFSTNNDVSFHLW